MVQQNCAEKTDDLDFDNLEDEYLAVESTLVFIAEHFAEPVTLTDLAWHAGMSRFTFCRIFQRYFGSPPIRWLWLLRIKAAREMILKNPDQSLTDVAYACGFSCSAHFSRCFKKAFGESPRAFKQASRLLRAGKSQTGNGLYHQVETLSLLEQIVELRANKRTRHSLAGTCTPLGRSAVHQ